MLRRLVSLAAAVLFCFGSAAAWSSESFIGDVYSLAPVSRAAVPFSDSVSFADRLSLASGSAWLGLYVRQPASNVAGVSTPAISYDVWFSGSPSSFYMIPESSGYTSYFDVSVPYNLGTSSLPIYPQSIVAFSFVQPSSVPSGTGLSGDSFYLLDVDVSDFGDFRTFELSGRLTCCSGYIVSGQGLSPWYYSGACISLLVNGAEVHRFYGDGVRYIDFGDFIYSASVPITSLQLSVYNPPPPYRFPEHDVSLRCLFGLYSLSSVSLVPLLPDEVLNGWNDQAQESLNKHEEYESQWVGSMTDNFNQLNLSNFTFPVGLVAGFGLLTGIFQDLWNVMGEYRILYVFPLTLAIVLLLVGRLAKNAVKDSHRTSSTKNKGGGPRA